jgi:hypothetical protein
LQHVFSKIYLRVLIRKAGTKVTPSLRRLIAVSLPRIPGFNPTPVPVEFVMDKVALREVSIRVLPFTPVSIAPPLLHTHSSLNRRYTNFAYTHTIITPTKCTLLLLKAPDVTICTFCLIFCPYMFQPAWVIFRGLNASAWLKLLLITIC